MSSEQLCQVYASDSSLADGMLGSAAEILISFDPDRS